MKRLALFAIAGFMAVACANNSESSESSGEELEAVENAEEMEKQLMEEHNEGMAKMQPARKLLAQLKEHQKTAEDTVAIQQGIKALREAEMAMMDWMNNYEKPSGVAATEGELENYLEQQEERMEEINDMLDEAIANAKELVGDEASMDEGGHSDHEGHDHQH